MNEWYAYYKQQVTLWVQEHRGKSSPLLQTLMGKAPPMPPVNPPKGNGRILEVDGKYIAQVKKGRGWVCLDMDKNYTWDYGSSNTLTWCGCKTQRQAQGLLNHHFRNLNPKVVHEQ
jgi:hypothetical protein